MERIFCFALAAVIAGPALGAGGDSGGYGGSQSSGRSAEYEAAAAHVGEERYGAAIPLLEAAVAAAPTDADAYSLLGFAYRKTGDYERSAPAYERALAIDPRHLNALEYQGELFLSLGDMEGAEANLAKISKQCLSTCEQERQLEAAIAEWRAAAGD